MDFEGECGAVDTTEPGVDTDLGAPGIHDDSWSSGNDHDTAPDDDCDSGATGTDQSLETADHAAPAGDVHRALGPVPGPADHSVASAPAAGPPSGDAPPGSVAPIPGTQSGYGVPISWDASGRPTHVVYSGVVEPRTSSVTVGGIEPLSGGAVPVDATHVTLGYVPQQIPSTTPPVPALDPASPGAAVQAQLRGLYDQTVTDINTRTLTGVNVDRSTGSYYGNGKRFTDFGDALGEVRHPSGP